MILAIYCTIFPFPNYGLYKASTIMKIKCLVLAYYKSNGKYLDQKWWRLKCARGCLSVNMVFVANWLPKWVDWHLSVLISEPLGSTTQVFQKVDQPRKSSFFVVVLSLLVLSSAIPDSDSNKKIDSTFSFSTLISSLFYSSLK